MLRSIVGIVVGYLVTAAMVIASQSLAIFKPDLAFEPSSADNTAGWLIYALATSFLAAIVGGFVAAVIAQVRKNLAITGFVTLILILGLGMAYFGAHIERPVIPPEVIAKMDLKERLMHARQPLWYSYSLPIIGAAGVFVGGRLRRIAK